MHRSIQFRGKYHKPDTENHSAEKRSTFFKEGTMLSKVEAGTDYGSMIGPGLAVNLGASETLPLLIPEDEPELNYLKPLTRSELEAVAGGPGWKKVRSRLFLLFWVGWLTILAIAITVIVQSPRPVAPHLPWWGKELFYRLQPALFMDADSTESGAISRVSEKLPYLKSLGVGVMILEGLFSPKDSLINMTQIDPRLGTLPEFHQFITNSQTAGMRVILDLCNNKAEILSNASDYVQDSLRYWLEQGVSGFEICNTDTAFTEKTLQKWRKMVKEFNTGGNERIIMLRERSDSVSGLNISESAINSSTVELVSRSLIPPSSHPLSASEVAEAIESMLKTLHGERPSWRVDGPVAWNLQKVVMVLMMTLPGTPVISYGDEISQAPNPHQPMRSTTLFHSLSHTRSHEEALLYGTFTFLTFNTTSLNFGSTNSTNSTAMPPLAFLRSWGCIHFLVLFNLGSESHNLDYNWTLSLLENGMVVTSTGLDRVGQVTLQSITLQPHEAIVIKLFETDPDF